MCECVVRVCVSPLQHDAVEVSVGPDVIGHQHLGRASSHIEVPAQPTALQRHPQELLTGLQIPAHDRPRSEPPTARAVSNSCDLYLDRGRGGSGSYVLVAQVEDKLLGGAALLASCTCGLGQRDVELEGGVGGEVGQVVWSPHLNT